MVCERAGIIVNRKFAIIFILSLIVMLFIMRVQENLTEASGLKMRIPEKAIRLRILANSDSAQDQAVKREIRDTVNADVEQWVHDLKSFNQAKEVIDSHLDDIHQVVQNKLKEKGIHQSYTVALGPAKFPTKLYGGFVYPAGTYEALVVTLGSGKGANWWCVLFPPLCFLDFEHGDAVQPQDQTSHHHDSQATVQTNKNQTQHVKVKFFFVDVFQKLVSVVKSWF